MGIYRAIGYMRDNLNTISYRYEDLVNKPDQMIEILRPFFKLQIKRSEYHTAEMQLHK